MGRRAGQQRSDPLDGWGNGGREGGGGLWALL